MAKLNEFCKPVIITPPNFVTSKIDEYKIFSDFSSISESEVSPLGLSKSMPQKYEKGDSRFSSGELRNVSMLENTRMNVWPTLETAELNVCTIFETAEVNVCPTFETAEVNVWPVFENTEVNVWPMFEIMELSFCSIFNTTSFIFESKIARLNSKSNGMAKTSMIPRHEFSWVILMLVSFSVNTPRNHKKIYTEQSI